MELCMRGSVVLLPYFLFIIITTKFYGCIGHRSPNSTLCREEEREALLSFKNGVYDPSNRLFSWAGEECCKWDGVICRHTTGHVVMLDLVGSQLNVKDDDLEWISGLPFLEYLDMSNLNLSKASNWLQVMNKLHYLSVLVLHDCGLSTIDPLPLPAHVNFSSLVTLDLSFNDLTSSSFDWFAYLSSLTTLDLQYNKIRGQIPSGLRNMTSLRFLDLSRNNFAGSFPDWFLDSMTALEHLDLGCIDGVCNMLHGNLRNDIIGNLSSITYLDLSANALEGDVLRPLGNLCAFQLSNFSYYRPRPRKSLEVLILGGNQLSGSFPDILGECKSLKYLDLGINRLSGPLPISLGGMSSLSYLNIRENLFEGILSEKHLAINLTSLETLDASSNLLTLQFTSNWTPPFQLYDLSLGSCFVGPQFPAWLQTLKSLKSLYMPYAGISGFIPDWFWARSYDNVDLSHNQIIGSIPSLRYSSIYLGSNNFTGPLPQISSHVVELDLSNNSLRGSLSRMLCRGRTNKEKANTLEYLDLSGNLLSGELPDCWMYWRMLTRLYLSNNNLTGRIPSSVGSLNWLGSLHLRNNHLFGEVPISLKNCSILEVLDLSENEFTGSIPAWMGNFNEKFTTRLNQGSIPARFTRFVGNSTERGNNSPGIEYTIGLMILVLRSNMFNGSIPVELCHLESLQILDLGNNNLSGTIPKCFGNLSSMIKPSDSPFSFRFHHVLDIFMPISTDTATLFIKGAEYEYVNNLGLLAGIDLSSNKLTGGIPQEITGLHGLIFLNLSRNHLQGKIPMKIGDMKSLESLDLSVNRLSGVIPQGMTTISFLSHLNLSYNNLSGEIPSGTQLRGFSPFSFIGNPELCGPPLTVDCGDQDGKPAKAPLVLPDNVVTEDNGSWIDIKWFCLGIPWGFAVGFWAIFAPLAFNRAWRHAYFLFLDYMKYKLLGWFL